MIQHATEQHALSVAQLALKLWPAHTIEELKQQFEQLLVDAEAAVFLAAYDGHFVGFAQCQLRHDYVEGTNSSPVGYLEGLYVEPHVREQGIARQLVAACEHWSKAQGCSEMGSDCELHNEQSISMHSKLGFQEANRIVCFTKKI